MMLATLLLCGCGRTAEAPSAQPSAGQPSAPPATPAIDEAGPAAQPTPVSACLTQDGGTLPAMSLHAIGTEPFWGADVEGRCVTYSTPENQAGVRIWTKFEGTFENGRWTGALAGQPFVMTTRADPRCSDGMSDTIYPIAVTLTVAGEERRGCAEPR